MRSPRAAVAAISRCAHACCCGRGLLPTPWPQPRLGLQAEQPLSTHANAATVVSAGALRRVNVRRGTAPSAAAAAAEAGGDNAAEGGLAEMSREVPGGAKPMHSWEKVYWGVGVTGVAAVLYWNLKKPEFTPEEIEAAKQRAADLEARRKEHLRAVLSVGSNFIEGDADPLDGLSPAQIVAFMKKHSIDPADPLEGLSPEEIDAYVQREQGKRQQQDNDE